MPKPYPIVILAAFPCLVFALACGEAAPRIVVEGTDDAAATDGATDGAVDGATPDVPDVSGPGPGEDVPPEAPACQTPADCVAAMPIPPCRKAVCAGSRCSLEELSEGAPCESGDACVIDELCVAGTCGGGKPLPCNDGDPCTLDTCNAGSCVHEVSTGGCDDGNPCTIADYCLDGACRGGNNACPCDPNIGTPACAKYETGDPCLGEFICQGGKCVVEAGTGSTCPVGAVNSCLVLGCIEGAGNCGALPLPKGTLCDDGDPCTVADACEAGICKPGSRQCPCEGDADCASFDNGNRCDGILKCTSGQCILDASSVVSCKDLGDPCAATACEPSTGSCVDTPSDGQACSDGDPCTQADACNGGKCAGSPKTCDDQNGCTEDACGSDGGCVFTPITGTCEDGNVCTKDDVCEAGLCKSGADVCSCNNDVDCVKFDDADTCTGVLVCVGKQCTPKLGSTLVCEQGADTECAKNTCKNSKCVLESVNVGLVCSDSDACTEGETCISGECQGGVSSCACNPPPEKYLKCGEQKSNWSNAAFGFTDAIDAWSCATGDWSAKEVAWPFFTNKPVSVTVDLLEETVKTSLFLLRDEGAGCVPASCVKSAPSTLTFVAKPDEPIYIVVDGKDGAEGKFTLNIKCNTAIEVACDNGVDEDNDGLTDCSDDDCATDDWCSTPEDCTNGVDDDNDNKADCADPGCAEEPDCHTLCTPTATIYCGFSQFWNTNSTGNAVTKYSCVDGLIGNDYFYTFNPTQTKYVTIDLPTSFPGAHVTVMEHQIGGCNGANCLAGGPPPVTFTAFAGTTYYVGVDGYGSGQYQMKVTCE